MSLASTTLILILYYAIFKVEFVILFSASALNVRKHTLPATIVCTIFRATNSLLIIDVAEFILRVLTMALVACCIQNRSFIVNDMWSDGKKSEKQYEEAIYEGMLRIYSIDFHTYINQIKLSYIKIIFHF